MRFSLPAIAMLGLLGAAGAVAEELPKYLDVFVVNIRPEKYDQFQTVMTRMAEANRKHKGDQWVTTETAYGNWGTYYIASSRTGLAAVEQSGKDFMRALTEAYGAAGMGKLLGEFGSAMQSGRTELQEYRPDLGLNVPSDREGLMQLYGKTRWQRSLVVTVKPGHVAEFEEQVKKVNRAYSRVAPEGVVIAAVAATGTGNRYYFRWPLQSAAAFDGLPEFVLRREMDSDSYARYVEMVASSVAEMETLVTTVRPELSNPPEGLVAQAPDFWRPKPKPAGAPAKPKAASPAKKN